MKKGKHTCNQCGCQMKVMYDTLWVCTYAACPNYALLQVPLEDMPKEKVRKK